MKIDSIDMDVVYPVLRQEAVVIRYEDLAALRKLVESGKTEEALRMLDKWSDNGDDKNV